MHETPASPEVTLMLPREPHRARGSRTRALFALGFRPFYLLAGAYAALGVPIWAPQHAGVLPAANALWHAHEMLFGYAFAVIAGFLLTAVRDWTAQPTPEPAAEGLRLGYRMMAIEVEDMRQALDALKKQGIEAVWGPVTRPTYARAEIRDPDGNHIELRQWIR